MSLLTVAQAIAEEVGLPAPATVVGNSDRTAKQLLRLINRAGRILAKKNWNILQKEHTFSTSASTASYDLPDDFDRFLDLSMWDRTQYWQMRGPLSPGQWQVKKSALIATVSMRSNFRVKPDTRVNKFFVDPTPTGIVSLVFEYASNQWVRDAANAAGKTAYALDTDVSLISEELLELEGIWRIRNRKGFAYAEEKLEADTQIDLAYANDRSISVLDMGVSRASPIDASLNVPEGGFG